VELQAELAEAEDLGDQGRAYAARLEQLTRLVVAQLCRMNVGVRLFNGARRRSLDRGLDSRLAAHSCFTCPHLAALCCWYRTRVASSAASATAGWPNGLRDTMVHLPADRGRLPARPDRWRGRGVAFRP
jgi:hypothetical protein